MPHSQMLIWLAAICKSARENADVKLADIAKAAGKDQSAVYRFEQGESVPRDIEAVVSAYAQTIGVPSQHLWADALAAWGKTSGVQGLRERAAEDGTELEQAVERAVQRALSSLEIRVSLSGKDRSISATPSARPTESQFDPD